ncbi:nucleocapsid [Leptomonas pyrrhocoris leishbunyavirus 3]|uniref:Nucleocapsid n=1 Tax=Leptomonas pyrrhocoris leishbunyavirus 3 TaxID=3070841 RepID=A0AA50KII5_9VIRU|nr:nucleocapsid [Leptomonas pyrrhocoris leishbunyavirus 3]WMB96306.1 nucleocapsid [Leptomonas pyrrhocoris leishbunyavirus 3]WMB96309.1 nucleocapsid [Leptomonas pyrrhocoris leishbunyavirus 3]WMB96312.1 nucleocapsid [Leptomonas pyrrhocoris leishbunyavirus 3]WMB96316.1 nucleocapsid [Leptomonas pyrrhocoris leishbunyavirus 3]
MQPTTKSVLEAVLGREVDLQVLLEEAEYRPELTSWDLRKHVVENSTEEQLQVAYIFSFIVTVAGTNFQKLGRRLTSVPDLVGKLDAHYQRFSFVQGKRIGKGKLAACFPEWELRAALVVAGRRPADCTARLPAYHFQQRIVKDQSGIDVPQGLDSFIAANNSFVKRISGGKSRLNDANRSDILRAIFADFEGKFREVTSGQSK